MGQFYPQGSRIPSGIIRAGNRKSSEITDQSSFTASHLEIVYHKICLRATRMEVNDFMENAAIDVREKVVNDVIRAMAPVVEVIQLQMLEGAVRGALHGLRLERECTELSTELDDTR